MTDVDSKAFKEAFLKIISDVKDKIYTHANEVGIILTEPNVHAMAEQYEATYSHASITEAWHDGYNFAADKYVIKLFKAKQLIKLLLDRTYGEGWNYSLDVKVDAEKFLKECEV